MLRHEDVVSREKGEDVTKLGSKTSESSYYRSGAGLAQQLKTRDALLIFKEQRGLLTDLMNAAARRAQEDSGIYGIEQHREAAAKELST